jgi:prevent-host-death family protein
VNVTTERREVGVRDLKNNLSRYLDRVQAGEELVVTDRGRPIARVTSIDRATDRLAQLVEAGIVRPPRNRRRAALPTRTKPNGNVSDLIDAQRR